MEYAWIINREVISPSKGKGIVSSIWPPKNTFAVHYESGEKIEYNESDIIGVSPDNIVILGK